MKKSTLWTLIIIAIIILLAIALYPLIKINLAPKQIPPPVCGCKINTIQVTGNGYSPFIPGITYRPGRTNYPLGGFSTIEFSGCEPLSCEGECEGKFTFTDPDGKFSAGTFRGSCTI